MGKRYLSDVLETMGDYVDALKFAGGSFALMRRAVVQELIELAHEHRVTVSTGGFIERVLVDGAAAIEAYLGACRVLGFDTVELSCGFITLPIDDWKRLVRKVHEFGLKAKVEVGIQFGAGGASSPEALEAAGTADPAWMIQQAQQLLEAGADQVMIESEGITENVRTWRTDVPPRVVEALGLERVMFEAADPAVFAWYVRNYGAEVNLFVDHSQIVQLECLRSGIWGTNELWGRVLTYKPE
jgi:phosphosulfolactate synthase (CoM biosynthesis protein A)